MRYSEKAVPHISVMAKVRMPQLAALKKKREQAQTGGELLQFSSGLFMDTSLFSEKLVQNVCPDAPFPANFDSWKVSALDHFTYLLAAGFEKRGDLLDREN